MKKSKNITHLLNSFLMCLVIVLFNLSGEKLVGAQEDEDPITTESEFCVDIYDPEKAYNGTTLFADLHDTDRPRIVEVDMNGNIVWEYVLPQYLYSEVFPGFDVEYLSDTNTVLFVASLKGAYEIYYHQEFKKDHLLLIIIEKEEDILRIVTVIDTSKISKYF